MALLKKDPSLRVAANDPHLVSLGGGRLSTAVTIHNIPIGDCSIGSSPQCSILLNGAGVKPIHCTIYRSEENQVSLVPELNARILIDNELIKDEVDLRQGAMITVGHSYYLRYNNPAEALKMRTAIGEISKYPNNLDNIHESNIDPHSKLQQPETQTYSYYDNLKKSETSVDFKSWQCPKLFTADLVTVNMPAKEVLGQKYANFAKNLAEHHRKDKNISVLNTSSKLNSNMAFHYWQSESIEKNNVSPFLKSKNSQHLVAEPKLNKKDSLEDMFKIFSDYTDRQDHFHDDNGSTTSSPVVQNRIKTNGSLPRDKKPFYQELQNSPKASACENIQLIIQNRAETVPPVKYTGYENINVVPKSPRNKIRTNYISLKMESNLNNSTTNLSPSKIDKSTAALEYLIKSFEEKFQKEIESIKENSSLADLSKSISPAASKRSFIFPQRSPRPLKKPTPAPRKIYEIKAAKTGSVTDLLAKNSYDEQPMKDDEDLLQRIQCLKAELSLLQRQDNEILIEMDMENALITAELESLNERKQKLEHEYQLLQKKIHRLEAQRNATRVMEENQQSKLKHSIEMKQDQVEKLKALLKQRPDICLKEELSNVRDSLENDKKSFEDLEFQYLEGESEWQAYRDDLKSEELAINKKIEECQLSIENLEKRKLNSSYTFSEKQRRLSIYLVSLIKDLQQCEKEFEVLEKKLSLKINSNSSLAEEECQNPPNIHRSQTQITQSLIGSTELLCFKRYNDNLMSKSFNENMIFSNTIPSPENAITFGNVNDLRGRVDSHEATSKIYDTMKRIEEQRQLLSTQKTLTVLDYQRRKIEEQLKNLKLEAKQPMFLKGETKIDDNTSSNFHQKQISQTKIVESSDAITSSSQFGSSLINKPINDLRISSSDSHRGFSSDQKRASSIFSNEPSLQCDDNSSILSRDHKTIQRQRQQRPLTRYLPIFADDFDLRRHIELAGHPITICPHIVLNTHSCRGYLQKLGSTFHAWSKRWFVFDRQRSALIYYADKSERKPKGGAYFSSIDEVYMDHLNIAKSSRPHSTFIVKTKKRSYYLQAYSDTAARIWIDAIITGAQGNIDY